MAQTGTGTVKVDDRDARIIYTPPTAWAVGGQADEYDATTTYTLTSYAFFNFTFQGTTLQVIGTLDGTTTPPTGGFTYQIDGGTELLRSAQTVTGTRTVGAVLVQVDSLPKGQHTLILKNGGPDSTKFVLDAIVYTPYDGAADSGAGGSGSGGGGSGSGGGGSNGGGGGSSSSSVNVGAIAGGVVGGILGLGLLVFLAIYAWRRRREANIFMDEHQDYAGKHPSSPPPHHSSTPPAYQPNGLAVLSHSSGPRSDVMSQASSSPPPTTVTPGPVHSQLPYDPSPLRYLDQHNNSQSNIPYNPYAR